VETIKSMTQNWWIVLLKGIIGVVLGLFFLANPDKSVAALVMLFGILIVVEGAIYAILGLSSLKRDKQWWVMTTLGVLGVLIGALIFNHPQVTLGLFFFLLAVWILVGGIMMLVLAVKAHKESYASWFFVGIAVVSLLVGFVIISNPAGSVRLLMSLAGIYVLVSGIFTAAYGLELHHIRSDAKKLEA
jgi:uncharacterized membrane protein HdeD (DUF308 family)